MAQTSFTIPGRGQVSEQQFTDYWRQVFASDPVIQQLMAEQGRQGSGARQIGSPGYQAQQQALQQRLAALGFTPPPDYFVNFMRDAHGNVALTPQKQGYVDRNVDWIAPLIAGAALAGPFAAGAMGGGAGAGAAGGGASAAPGALPVTSAGAGLGTPIGMGAAPGVTAATATNPYLGALAKIGLTGKDAMGVGLSVAGQYFQNRSDNNARDKALAEDTRRYEEALRREDAGLRRAGDIYNQQRSDFQNLAGTPYGTLGGLLGMNIQPVGPLGGIGTPPARLAAQRSGAPMLQLPKGGTLRDFTRL